MVRKTIHRHGRRPVREQRHDPRLLVMRDLVDLQVESADGIDIGRVDDVEAVVGANGELRLSAILAGPQALAGRLSSRLRPLVRRVLRDRFDVRIPIEEVAEVQLFVRLRGDAEQYRLGASDRWLAEHVLRRIPGGRR